MANPQLHTQCSDACWLQFPLFRSSTEGNVMPCKAVFLDRDKTLIEDPGYISDPSLVKLLPGVADALRMLSEAGYKLVLVTNQSGIARGMLSEERLALVHGELNRQLAEHGAALDAIYYCPFHPEGTVAQYTKETDCRKPGPGMLLQAASEMYLDLSNSWMVGDSARDIEAGKRALCRTVRIRSGPPQRVEGELQADYTVADMLGAARTILHADSPQGKGERKRRPAVGQDALPAEAAPEPADAQLSEPAPAIAPCACQPAIPQPPGGEEVSHLESRLDEVARQLHKLSEPAPSAKRFSVSKLLAGAMLSLTLLAMGLGLMSLARGGASAAIFWVLLAVAMALLSVSFYIMRRD